ncbi:hypothetical protein FJZ20_00165 [Candidatus Pacearchaeota archaeon]|nr:hypothetical protein [Candidatus Pacearchaeota archaeon]
MNKKGDKLISVYWFVILFIVAAAIVYMVHTFYGKPYDVRQIEADLLISKIARCVSEGGYLKEGVFGEDFKGNFGNFCNLNLQVEDSYGWREQEQYYLGVEILKFDSYEKVLSLQEGNKQLKDFCGQNEKNFPICLERSLYSLDKEGNSYKINLISIVRKTEKNVY